MTDILVIPDAHVKHNIPLDNFILAARLILERQPEYVVLIGDLVDFESLSYYDKGKRGYEARRLHLDFECFSKVFDTLLNPIHTFNTFRKIQKKGQYKPTVVFCEGNHEYRLHRLFKDEPRLEGEIKSIRSRIELLSNQYDINIIYKPYLEPIELEGVYFVHCVKSGSSFNEIGGVNAARSMALETMVSTVVGHSHLLDYHQTSNFKGERIIVHVAGNFLHPDQKEDYATWQGNNRWCEPSVSYLHNVKEGNYDLEIISQKRLKLCYG